MNKAIVRAPFVYANALDVTAVDAVIERAAQSDLPLSFEPIKIEQKLTQKVRKQLSEQYAIPLLVLDEKQNLSLVANQISVAPEWQTLQRRVVRAGRKSELILQACKLNEDNRALDATAGFGHDSLILASTGAQVTLLERNPLIALLLLHEQQVMAQHKNWHKLMARLNIICADSAQYMQQRIQQAVPQSSQVIDNSSEHHLSDINNDYNGYDVVYLDPMFPENSYEHASTNKGAKVGKHMQALHHIANPPDSEEEARLLNLALTSVKSGGRVVVKRPVSAPVFANKVEDETWQNDVVRFDGYFA